MGSSGGAPLLPWSCSWWNCIPRGLFALDDPEKWEFSLENTVPFHWLHWRIKDSLRQDTWFEAMPDKLHPSCTSNATGYSESNSGLIHSLFFWCFLAAWCFYYTGEYQERCKTKLERSGERRESGMISITLHWLQLLNLLTVLSRFCIELLHTLLHFRGNETLQVEQGGTGETGNLFKVLQTLLKGMTVPLGSWLDLVILSANHAFTLPPTKKCAERLATVQIYTLVHQGIKFERHFHVKKFEQSNIASACFLFHHVFIKS